ncbi:hypothetical protein PISMIDRAFT_105388, partial [Pisolithus microcarpus 441]
DESITLKHAALEYMSPDEPQRQTILLELDNHLFEHFKQMDSTVDLEEIISLCPVLGLCPPGHPDHTLSQDHLACYLETTWSALNDPTNLLFKKFKKYERDHDLDAMIMLGQTALEFTPPEHPLHLSTLIHLLGLLSKWFNQYGRKEDLDKLITLKCAGSEYMSPDKPQRQTILLELDGYLLNASSRQIP